MRKTTLAIVWFLFVAPAYTCEKHWEELDASPANPAVTRISFEFFLPRLQAAFEKAEGAKEKGETAEVRALLNERYGRYSKTSNEVSRLLSEATDFSLVAKKLGELETKRAALHLASEAFLRNAEAAIERGDSGWVRDELYRRYKDDHGATSSDLRKALFERKPSETALGRYHGIKKLELSSGSLDEKKQALRTREGEHLDKLTAEALNDPKPASDKDPNKDLPRPKTYAEANKLDPDEYITVTHGGGFRYINDFLAGKHFGYRLHDGKGYGLQVTPENPQLSFQRDAYYAEESQPRFDDPAVLTFRIQRKYLDMASSTNYGYEAGFRPEFIAHMKDIQLFSLERDVALIGPSAKELKPAKTDDIQSPYQ